MTASSCLIRNLVSLLYDSSIMDIVFIGDIVSIHLVGFCGSRSSFRLVPVRKPSRYFSFFVWSCSSPAHRRDHCHHVHHLFIVHSSFFTILHYFYFRSQSLLMIFIVNKSPLYRLPTAWCLHFPAFPATPVLRPSIAPMETSHAPGTVVQSEEISSFRCRISRLYILQYDSCFTCSNM